MEVHSAHSLVKHLLRKSHLQKKQLDYSISLVLHKLQEQEISLVLDLSSHSMDVQRQLLGITTRLPSMYSVAKTMRLHNHSILLQQFSRTMVLLQILLLQEKKTTVQLSILLPLILLQEQLILLVLLRLQEQDLISLVVLYSQHLEQQKQSVLKKNLQVYSVYLQHPHLLVTLTDSAGMHHLLKVVYSLLVVELRKSPSTIMIVLLLYSHLQTMVLLPMLLQLTKITEALLIL